MRRLPSTLAILFALPAPGCVGSTECSCVAPVVVVVGTITGTSAPLAVDVGLSPGVCRDGVAPARAAGTTLAGTERSYSVPVDLPQPGPVCIVVTAATLDLPLVTATRRVDAVITTAPMAGPQQVRADVAFATP